MAETKGTGTSMNFGKKLTELEAIAGKLEHGDLDLETGIAQYEQGMKLVQELRAYLDSAANRVEDIRQKYQDKAPAADPRVEEVDDLPF